MLKGIAIFMFAFILGVFATGMYANLSAGSLSTPMGMQGTADIPGPQDIIKEEDIAVYNNRVVIYLDNPQWASFSPTKSMDPVLDAGHNAIERIPKTMDDIEVGDIISYKSNIVDSTIIHRVIYKARDDNGEYLIMKGDNNQNQDPEKVRFDQVRRQVVGIIY